MGLYPIIMPIRCQLIHKWQTLSFSKASIDLPEDSAIDSILHPPLSQSLGLQGVKGEGV